MAPKKWLPLIGIASLIVLVDQVTKALVVANLDLYEQWAPVESLRHLFTFTYVQNTGAAFGLFQDGGALFAVIALVVVGLIVYFYRELPDAAPLVRSALGLQLGGAMGNLIDRLTRGYVVDFFDFKFWPVFNIADSAIVVGVISLVVLMWLADRRAAKAAENADDEPSSLAP